MPMSGCKTPSLALLLLTLSLTIESVRSGEASMFNPSIESESASPPSVIEWSNLFDRNTLYEGDGAIRSVKLTGRYHGRLTSQTKDGVFGGIHQREGYHDYDHTSFRLGTKIDFAHHLSFLGTMNMADGAGGAGSHGFTYGVFFDDLSDFYLSWDPSPNFYVRVGKLKQSITREYSSSLNQIYTVERSALVNSLSSNKPWGASVGFKLWGLSQEIGARIIGGELDSTSERWNWPDLNSRGSASYRASRQVTDATTLYFDYLFTDNPATPKTPGVGPDSSLGSPFEHVAAFGTETKGSQGGLVTDLIFAQNGMATGALRAGYDTWGLSIIPYLNLTDKLRFVTRYAYMDQGPEQIPQRFNTRASVAHYHTFYTGLTYRIHDDQLKVMLGHEYAIGDQIGTSGNQIDSSTWMLSLRTYW